MSGLTWEGIRFFPWKHSHDESPRIFYQTWHGNQLVLLHQLTSGWYNSGTSAICSPVCQVIMECDIITVHMAKKHKPWWQRQCKSGEQRACPLAESVRRDEPRCNHSERHLDGLESCIHPESTVSLGPLEQHSTPPQRSNLPPPLLDRRSTTTNPHPSVYFETVSVFYLQQCFWVPFWRCRRCWTMQRWRHQAVGSRCCDRGRRQRCAEWKAATCAVHCASGCPCSQPPGSHCCCSCCLAESPVSASHESHHTGYTWKILASSRTYMPCTSIWIS